eukprot:15431177-Alexandrium_andersonii.AAC.1
MAVHHCAMIIAHHGPTVQATTPALNDPVAETEKGPKFHMEEAAAPASPQGETSLSRALNRQKVGNPF